MWDWIDFAKDKGLRKAVKSSKAKVPTFSGTYRAQRLKVFIYWLVHQEKAAQNSDGAYGGQLQSGLTKVAKIRWKDLRYYLVVL